MEKQYKLSWQVGFVGIVKSFKTVVQLSDEFRRLILVFKYSFSLFILMKERFDLYVCMSVFLFTACTKFKNFEKLA